MDTHALRAEVVGDPLVRGYSAMTDAEVTESGYVLDCSVPVESITGQQLFEAVLPAEYNSLTDTQKQLLLGIVGMGVILVSGTNTRAAILGMFGLGTGTRANLVALQTELVGRWTELQLDGVAARHVRQVRNP